MFFVRLMASCYNLIFYFDAVFAYILTSYVKMQHVCAWFRRRRQQEQTVVVLCVRVSRLTCSTASV